MELELELEINEIYAVLRIRIRDPVFFLPLDPGCGFGMNIPDNFSDNLETVFRFKNT
jgi:hypothetical protein